jgi:hypothetical protein
VTTFLLRLWLAINPVARERRRTDALRKLLAEEIKKRTRLVRMFEQLASQVAGSPVVLGTDLDVLYCVKGGQMTRAPWTSWGTR